MTTRRRRVLSTLVALAAVVVVFVLLRGQREEALPAPTQDPPATVAAAAAPAAPSFRVETAELHPVEGEALGVDRLKQQYEDYKAGSIYPDWSYPLTPDQDFLLSWNAAVTNDLPVDDAQTIFFRFDAEKGRVFAGEAYVSWAEAWTMENGRKKPLPVRFERAAVVLTSGPNQGDVFELTYHDDGLAPDAQAGDFRYSNRFVPSERKELATASSARVEAIVEVDGHQRRFLRDFTWAPRDVLKVVGEHDAIVDGSLVATLDCQVLEDGLYTVYGNLFAADGTTPIATSKKSYPLKAGRQTVKLVFFGKVLNDQQVDGPYVLKDVHGLKRMGDAEYNNVWWQHVGEYRTHAYASADFSGDEWNDPERTERLATFERVIHEMETRQASR
jgi:hypothetical protein